MIEESHGRLETYDNGDGPELISWDQVESHATPCEPCDEFEMHFICTDEFGIQYDFIAEKRVITGDSTDKIPAICWPQTVTPTITWPE